MTAVNLAAMFGADERTEQFPTDQPTAFFVGCLFLRLGGSFHIGPWGDRRLGRPEPVAFRLNGQGCPHLPNAQPHEQFRNDDEWRGAIKLVMGLINRMSEEDRDFLFGMFAPAPIDPAPLIPSIEEPKRRAK